MSRRLARGGNLARSPRAKEGSTLPEHRPCNGRSQGLPGQMRKLDVRKAGRQPPPVPPGQRTIDNVASLGATVRARDGFAHPKQQLRQARPTATSRGKWRGVGNLPKIGPRWVKNGSKGVKRNENPFKSHLDFHKSAGKHSKSTQHTSRQGYVFCGFFYNNKKKPTPTPKKSPTKKMS